jgi:hypothetical protein
MANACGVLAADDVPEDPFVTIVTIVVVLTRATDAPEKAPPYAVQLAVGDPVGVHELTELDEQFPCERLVPAEALRLANEPQQSLRIAPSECRQGTQRYDECRMDSTFGLNEPV